MTLRYAQLRRLFERVESDLSEPTVGEPELLEMLEEKNADALQTIWVGAGYPNQEIVRAFAAYKAKRDYIPRGGENTQRTL